MHEYDEGISDSCKITTYYLILERFSADATTKFGDNRGPLVISEWVHDETDAAKAWEIQYSVCLGEFIVNRQLGMDDLGVGGGLLY
jgi:hypothetical protein